MQDLICIGETRKAKQDRENYKEHVDKVFGPYQAVEKMDEIKSKNVVEVSQTPRIRELVTKLICVLVKKL